MDIRKFFGPPGGANKKPDASTSNKAKPSTTPNKAKPSTTPKKAKPSTTSKKAKPSTTPKKAKPSTTPKKAKPSTTPNKAKPSTTPNKAKPSTTPNKAKPITTSFNGLNKSKCQFILKENNNQEKPSKQAETNSKHEDDDVVIVEDWSGSEKSPAKPKPENQGKKFEKGDKDNGAKSKNTDKEDKDNGAKSNNTDKVDKDNGAKSNNIDKEDKDNGAKSNNTDKEDKDNGAKSNNIDKEENSVDEDKAMERKNKSEKVENKKSDKRRTPESKSVNKKRKKSKGSSDESEEDFTQKAGKSSKHRDNSNERSRKKSGGKEHNRGSKGDDKKAGKAGRNKSKEDGEKSDSAKKKSRSRSKEKLTISDSEEEVMVVDSANDSDTSPAKKKTQKSRKRNQKLESEEESDDDVSRRVSKKGSKKKKKKKKNTLRISDSDSEQEIQPKIPRDRKKMKPRFCESDEEIQSPIKQFFKPKAAGEKSASPKSAKSTVNVKAVSITDFFGSATVQRTERKTAVKRKAPESFEDEFHSDDDFLATLAQLDEETHVEKKVKVESPEKKDITKDSPEKKDIAIKTTPVKMDVSPKSSPEKKPGTSLTAKLASKIKSENEEPVRSSPRKKTTVSPIVSPAKVTSSNKPAPPIAMVSPTKINIPETPPIKPPIAMVSPTKINIPETPPIKASLDRSGYKSYLTREGPKSLGSKEIPEGADNCLEGLTFVITGVLESIERDEAKSLVERYGGRVTVAVSGKTSYLVLGREAGESKIRKAESLRTPQLDEDGLLDLIRNRPGKKSKYLINAEAAVKKEAIAEKKHKLSKKVTSDDDNDATVSPKPLKDSPKPLKDSPKPLKDSPKSLKDSPKQLEDSPKPLKDSPKKTTANSKEQSPKKSVPSTSATTQSSDAKKPSTSVTGSNDLLWVDKYKPLSLKQIIGQSGDKSNAKKLLNWIKNWHSNRVAGVKPSSNRFFGGNDNGAGLKAALLSGPPGIGKTTTAHIVCQEAGFSLVEMNASDTRSKSHLHGEVMTLLKNTSLVDFCETGVSDTNGLKHCLIMDEVDGMAGNEDRGGIAEMIQLIKTSKIPVICLCNDRQHQKIRSLANYCFDLRFQRPRVEQIKAAMMTLAFKEGIKIGPPALNEIILAANHDIRQVIHNLSMWSASGKSLSYDDAKSNAQMAKKDMKLSPFDVCRKVFVGGEETRGMTLIDKCDLFFHDYQLSPLFVQENYPHVHPFAGRGSMTKQLSLLARAADSICDGDVTDRLIRQGQNWSLLPIEAVYASVLPGEFMRGGVGHMISFPSWLGKFSARNKNRRVLQELGSHMRLKISADVRGLNLDYLPCLQRHLVKPLVDHDKEGVPQVIQMMDDYDIIKEDYDNIMEITKWPNSVDYTKSLSSTTKAAFTRTYNKESHITPYATGTITKKRGKGGSTADVFGEDDDAAAASNAEDSDSDKNIDLDTMIKKKKPEAKKTQKGKGKAKGKGKS